MIADILIIAGLVIVAVIAGREALKHIKGQGACCGGGGETVAEPDKKLDSPVIGTKLMKIEGMTCENCENRVKRALNRIEGVSARVSCKSGEAVITYSKEPDEKTLRFAVENLDYHVTEIL